MAKINREQAAAASHPSGHALVLAGPGTGKTSTLVARHAFLRSRGRDPLGIMAVTFTQKAAEELKTRLGVKAPSDSWIGTFHSLSARFLKRFHAEAGLRRNFKILDPSGQRQLIAEIGIRWDSDDGDLTDIIGRWKDALVDPAEAAVRSTGITDGHAPLRLAAEHYAAYEEELARRGDLDFADLVRKAWKLIAETDAVGEFIASRFTDILVDEFQDVNRVQVELLMALAARGASIWAVADDDQALYGWRGGDVRLTVNFSDRFKGARSYTLVENYRCDPAILAAANTLIARNKTRVRKSLKAARPHKPGNVVRVRAFRTDREEADWIAAELRRVIGAGTRPQDISILFRTASVTPMIQQSLEAAGVPFALTGASNFWEMPEVRMVADLLAEIERGVAGEVASRFRIARDLVSTMAGSKPRDAAPAVGRAVGETPPAGSSGERASLWADTAEAAAAIAATHPDSASFRDHVSVMSSKNVSDGADAVAISTIHSSKGLEWSHVVIAGCESSLMPHHRNKDVEEERRLLYVGLTRSKGAVDLTFSRARFGRGQNPSPFLAELAASPKGAVVWPGGDGGETPTDRAPAQPAAKPAPTATTVKGLATYRKRGGRSLVPPGEE